MTEQDIVRQGGKIMATGLGLAIATAIGISLGVIFAPKKGTTTRKEIVEKAKELATKFKKTRKEIRESIEKIFGEFTKDLEESYLEIQGNILASVDEVQNKADLTRKKYDEIVATTVEKFSEGKKWSEQTIKDLVKELQKDWN